MPVCPDAIGLYYCHLLWFFLYSQGVGLAVNVTVLFLLTCLFGWQGSSCSFTCLPCPYCGHAMDMRFFFLCVCFVLCGTSRGSVELLRSLSGPLGGVSGPWGIPLLCFLGAPLEGLTPGLAWVLIWSTLLQKPSASASLLLGPYHLLSSYFCGIFPLVASQEIMRGVMF